MAEAGRRVEAQKADSYLMPRSDETSLRSWLRIMERSLSVNGEKERISHFKILPRPLMQQATGICKNFQTGIKRISHLLLNMNFYWEVLGSGLSFDDFPLIQMSSSFDRAAPAEVVSSPVQQQALGPAALSRILSAATTTAGKPVSIQRQIAVLKVRKLDNSTRLSKRISKRFYRWAVNRLLKHSTERRDIHALTSDRAGCIFTLGQRPLNHSTGEGFAFNLATLILEIRSRLSSLSSSASFSARQSIAQCELYGSLLINFTQKCAPENIKPFCP
eukprot:284815745_2